MLGSGLGEVVKDWGVLDEKPFREVAGMPSSSVAGHAGRFLFCALPGGSRGVVMQGRVHLYEGHPPDAVTAGVRLMHDVGAEQFLVTNAAGGIRDDLEVGGFMRLVDHINLTGCSPLEAGVVFVDMTDAYDRRLGRLLDEAAKEEGVAWSSGIYAGVRGPQYETPAEVRMLRKMGADAVGMSTVLEVIEARRLGLCVGGVSLITNRAAGLAAGGIDHDEVVGAGAEAGVRLGRVLTRVLGG